MNGLAERTNAFVTLVFGYSVVVILYQNKAEYGINAYGHRSNIQTAFSNFFAVSLAKPFSAWFRHFASIGCILKSVKPQSYESWYLRQHADSKYQMRSTFILTRFGGPYYHVRIPRSASHRFAWLTFSIISATVWINVHLPFIMSYVLAGASLSKLVLAHDHHDTDLETLGDLYLNRSEDHIPDALRWFYCVGLGIALLCMSKSFILPPLPLLTSLFFTKLTTPTSLDLYIPHPQRNPGPTHRQTLPPRRPRLDIPHPLLPTSRTRPQLPQTSRHHHGLNRLSPGRWSLRININEWFVLAWWECVQVFRRLFGEEEGHWDGAEERGEDSGWGVGERGDWRKVLFWVGGWKEGGGVKGGDI